MPALQCRSSLVCCLQDNNTLWQHHSHLLRQQAVQAAAFIVLLQVLCQLKHKQQVMLHLSNTQLPCCLLLLLPLTWKAGMSNTAGAAVAAIAAAVTVTAAITAAAAAAARAVEGAQFNRKVVPGLSQQLHAVAV